MRVRQVRVVLLCAAVLAAGRAGAQGDAFAIRGIKGLWWEGIEKYRLALPWLAQHKLNFLMLCYSSFPASGSDWRADYTPKELAQFRELNRQADGLGVRTCLSFNPGIWSKPPLTYSSERDYGLALRKVRMLHDVGFRWFSVCLDDIGRELEPADRERYGTLQAAQCDFVNRLWADLKRLDPDARLIFCPSAYTTEDARAHQDYIRTVGETLDPGVLVFWTGPTVCSTTITAEDARTFARWIGRKPFVWDNYPVNDMFPWRPLLAPVRGRSADLAGEVAGYLANPMKQWHASTLPLATLAEYLSDPAHYSPNAALGRAIAAYPKASRPIVRELMALYGSSFLGQPGYPPKPRPASRDEARTLLPRYRALARGLAADRALSGLWEDVRPTVEADVRDLERRSRDRRYASPLKALGDDFEGGAGEVYGFSQFGRVANYVYATPTGRSAMRAAFWLQTVPRNGATLRLVARDDDSRKKLRVAIAMNGQALVDGPSPFRSEDWTTRTFEVPTAALHAGRNELVVRNLEPAGVQGMPPWFMVAEAELVLAR